MTATVYKFYTNSCGACGRMKHYDRKVAEELGYQFVECRSRTKAYTDHKALLDKAWTGTGHPGYPSYVIEEEDGSLRIVRGGMDKGRFREKLSDGKPVNEELEEESELCSPDVSGIRVSKGSFCSKEHGGGLVELSVESSCCEPRNGRFQVEDRGVWKDIDGMPGVDYSTHTERKDVDIDLNLFPFDIGETGSLTFRWTGDCNQKPGHFARVETIYESEGCGDPCYGVNCPEGHECINGECVGIDPCRDVTCPEGHECINGECVAIDPCRNVDCPANSSCADGRCVCDDGYKEDPDSSEFTCIPIDPCENVICPEGEKCEDGKCVDACKDVVCGENQVCSNGKCICAPNFEPDPDQSVLVCIPIDKCRDVECPDNSTCYAGDCICDDGFVEAEGAEGTVCIPDLSDGLDCDGCAGGFTIPASDMAPQYYSQNVMAAGAIFADLTVDFDANCTAFPALTMNGGLGVGIRDLEINVNNMTKATIATICTNSYGQKIEERWYPPNQNNRKAALRINANYKEPGKVLGKEWTGVELMGSVKRGGLLGHGTEVVHEATFGGYGQDAQTELSYVFSHNHESGFPYISLLNVGGQGNAHYGGRNFPVMRFDFKNKNWDLRFVLGNDFLQNGNTGGQAWATYNYASDSGGGFTAMGINDASRDLLAEDYGYRWRFTAMNGTRLNLFRDDGKDDYPRRNGAVGLVMTLESLLKKASKLASNKYLLYATNDPHNQANLFSRDQNDARFLAGQSYENTYRREREPRPGL